MISIGQKSRATIKGRLFEGYIDLSVDSIVYFVRRDNCWEAKILCLKWRISWYGGES